MIKKEILDAIHGKMIISCQAVKGEPLYVEEKSIMYLMARAAKQAGTPAIRTSSIRDVIAIKEETGLPVIGLVKIQYPGYEGYITPTMKEVDDLVAAGSDIVALDCTLRKRGDGTTVNEFVARIKEKYPDIISEETVSLPEAMSEIYTVTGNKFIVIIDEWDILIRDEANNRDEQENYINFLRGMFKGTEPTRFISLAYLTGILPIKKMKTQSALNNFDEFTMLDAGALASYIGFTELEVEKLCDKYHKDFAEVKRWYDGYVLENQQVYNPKAVVSVMLRGNFQSYWSQTGTYEVVVPLINMDFDGLKQAIIEMVSGSTVEVDTGTFQNDTVSFSSRDDVITYLIHLGYLAYDQRKQCAFIPNEEIRQELLAATKKTKWNELQEFEYQSEQLLEATLDREETLVADYIEQIHMEYASAIQYHNENSLSSVLTIAYLSAMKYYFKPIRELPTGRGFSDFVFIPKEEYRVDYPALVVELKWNKSAHTELQQIKDKKYPESLLQYTGNILLVGINYDKKSKAHECVIEEYKR